jgi:hypothetical protein
MPQNKDLVSIAMREGVAFSKMDRRLPPGITAPDVGLPASFALDLQVYRQMFPVYHFNAIAASHMLPPNGVFVHFGVDAVQFLIYLAQKRPDIYIIGLEPRFDSVAQQIQAINASELTNRMQIVHVEMGQLSETVPDVADLFSSILSFNRLANDTELSIFMHQAALVRIHSGAGFWFFDYARLKSTKAIEDLLPLCFPNAGGPLRVRERTAMQSAFSFPEIASAAVLINVGDVQSALSKPLGYYQAHWLQPTGSGIATGHNNWRDEPLPPAALKEFLAISQMFPQSITA